MNSTLLPMVVMSDNDIEDVSFLPGQNTAGKRSVYEPRGPTEKCRQLICSRNRAILILIGATLFIVLIASISAFARQGSNSDNCEVQTSTVVEKTNKNDGLATNGEPFPWKDIRLPTHVQPVTYDLYMHPNLTTFTFSGKVDIEIEAVDSVDFIVLHLKHMNISNLSLKDKNGKNKYQIKKILYYVEFEQKYIQLQKNLEKSKRYILTLEFNGVLSDLLVGFYKSSYVNKKNETRWLATTHMEPTDARAAFPCFDEPHFKASFSMKMARENSYISLFNTELVKTEDHPKNSNLKIDHFATSVKMSTYLVAFVVCDYKSISNTTSDGVKVSVYTPPDQIDQAKFALEAATSILEYYEHFFGIPYPLKKQDLIAIPDFAAGAMENWGLITYRMVALLYDPAASSASNQQWVAVVVAHELAHQWFGNYVTMTWWNDLWLNEGFASFVEYIGTDYLRRSWRMLDQFVSDTLVAALHSDSLRSSHPVSVPVTDPAQINEIFDQISYEKGSSIIRMMEGFLSREVLEEGLKLYLQNFAYSNAETKDLWDAMSEKAKEKGVGVDVGSVMDTWTLQMGYPLVTVSRSGNKVTATQQRFLLNPRGSQKEEFESPFGYKWHIPLTTVTSQDPQTPLPLTWMKQDSVSFSLKTPRDTDGAEVAWVKMNVGFGGFYRVQYAADNWAALTAALVADRAVLSAADRANLLDDAFALTRSGSLDVVTALELSRYLSAETDYVPWTVGLENLHYVGGLLEGGDGHAHYTAYVTRLLHNMLQTYDWVDHGSHLDKYLRGLVLGTAVKINHKPSVNKARQLYQDWMEKGVTISPNLKGVVYVAGIRYGGLREWEHAWRQYKATTVPSEKTKLLYALSMSTDTTILNRYLRLSLNPAEIRQGDTVMVITCVAGSSPGGAVLAWRFVQRHWTELTRRYGTGSFDMSRLVTRTTARFTTQYDHDDVAAFFNTHDSGSGRRAVAQALEAIEMNIDWLSRNEASTVAWLEQAAAVEAGKPGEATDRNEL